MGTTAQTKREKAKGAKTKNGAKARGGRPPRVVDEVDWQLVQLLQLNPRASNPELAEQLWVSSATVRRRKERLVKQGFLSQYYLLNPRKMGIFDAMFGVKVEPSRLMEVGREIADLPDSRTVTICSGPYDILVMGFFRSGDDLFEFMRSGISTVPGVLSVETVPILRAIKRNYVWLEK